MNENVTYAKELEEPHHGSQVFPLSICDTPCRFHNLGSCRNGVSCRFLHSIEPPEANAPTVDGRAVGNPNWVDAAVFVPKADFHVINNRSHVSTSTNHKTDEDGGYNGFEYSDGDICDLCGLAVLHRTSLAERKKHAVLCFNRNEQNVALSYAIARSREKICGVCFEVIMEKPNDEQRFGILPNCNHCFCLMCIRKWRQSTQFANKIIRACPQCRVTSDFVCPSVYWVDTKASKERLIADYKGVLVTKQCKYYQQGSGKCPFGNKCFYLHALPDGTRIDVGPPQAHESGRDQEVDWQQLLLMVCNFDSGAGIAHNLGRLRNLRYLVERLSDSEDSDESGSEFNISFS